jgi:hypothetical protein
MQTVGPALVIDKRRLEIDLGRRRHSKCVCPARRNGNWSRPPADLPQPGWQTDGPMREQGSPLVDK